MPDSPVLDGGSRFPEVLTVRLPAGFLDRIRALAKSAPGTKNALAFTNRLLMLAGSSAAPRERRH